MCLFHRAALLCGEILPPSPPIITIILPSSPPTPLHDSACICNDFNEDNPMCSLHTYNPNPTVTNNNKTNNNEEVGDDDDDDDIIIESKNDNDEETNEEEKHDDNGDDIIIEREACQ